MRIKNDSHLDYIRNLPCAICGDNIATEAAHIRAAYKPLAKPITGMGIKPADCYTLPLCSRHHREQHQIGEATFWDNYHIGINGAVMIAQALYCHSGDHERGEEIVSWWRR